MTTPPLPGFGWLQLISYLLSLLAAVMALILTWRRRSHGPVAILLGVNLVADTARAAVHAWVPSLAGPVPYEGSTRLAYHVEQALYLLWPALLAWAALRVLTGRRSDLRCASAWAGLVLLLVVLYPDLHGESLRQVYLLATMGSLFAGLAAVAIYLRDHRPEGSPSAAVLVVVALISVEFVSLLLGPWSHGLFGEPYQLEQVTLCFAFAFAAMVQGGALLERQ